MANHNIGKQPPTVQKPEPPQPPPFQRKLQIAPLQMVVIPLLLLIPLLALFGLFGENHASAQGNNQELNVRVDYVSRYRYKMINTMMVEVTNQSGQSPITITVAFDRSYIDGFSEVTFTPSTETITAEAYEVELTEVAAGETRVVEVEMRGEHYWTHKGLVSASGADGEPVEIAVRTTVLP